MRSHFKRYFHALITALHERGNAGIDDVSYAVYDMYFLSEFNQKGAVRTKYGTRENYSGPLQHSNEPAFKSTWMWCSIIVSVAMQSR